MISNKELLKSETPQSETAKSGTPRHEIIEEHHAVLPVSAEHKKTTDT